MTPPRTAPPTESKQADYLGALKNDEPPPRWPSYRGGPALDPMIEDEYRFGWFGQADYDGHLGGGA
ncbi:hypothetical protein [Nonomuraea sp. NEAU-A123]|uniref:hypothetical protein n=1 Tax=Nonomuraea sp. NEAU-A123 TaxID=2839649 RepID=UPI001BE4596C|nr:hypothetical protein [Nonomuraea sp. NEAU-A123]MBT2234805.1 hypothetical protein [Nonomuraea sp. NEAU-A123]